MSRENVLVAPEYDNRPIKLVMLLTFLQVKCKQFCIFKRESSTYTILIGLEPHVNFAARVDKFSNI